MPVLPRPLRGGGGVGGRAPARGGGVGAVAGARGAGRGPGGSGGPPGTRGGRRSSGDARGGVRSGSGVQTAEGFDHPDEVYVGSEVPGGVVFLVYGPARRPRALLTAFATGTFVYGEKSA